MKFNKTMSYLMSIWVSVVETSAWRKLSSGSLKLLQPVHSFFGRTGREEMLIRFCATKKKYKVNFWLLYAVFATIFQKAFWVKFPEFEPKEHIFPTNFCNSFRFGCISQPCNKSRMGFYKSSLSKYTIFLLKFESLASCGAI